LSLFRFFFKILPLLLTVLGVFLAYILYAYNLNWFFLIKQSKIYQAFYVFFSKKWYFDRIYNQLISQNLLYLGYFLTYQQVDRGLLELIGPFGITNTLKNATTNLKYLQSGHISQYLFLFFFITLIFLHIGISNF